MAFAGANACAEDWVARSRAGAAYTGAYIDAGYVDASFVVGRHGAARGSYSPANAFYVSEPVVLPGGRQAS